MTASRLNKQMLSEQFEKNDSWLEAASKPAFEELNNNDLNRLDLTKWVMKQAMVGFT